MKFFIEKRRLIQLAFGILIYISLFYFRLNLLYLLLATTLLGIVFGKFFCKWMCPMGFIMELMTRNMNDEQKNNHMYNYYKVGCPISWIQGLLNKFSIFRIINDKATCLSCGKCDRVCYITSLNKEASIYKEGKQDPTIAFNCSKCLSCVANCPNGSLSYTTIFTKKK